MVERARRRVEFFRIVWCGCVKDVDDCGDYGCVCVWGRLWGGGVV